MLVGLGVECEYDSGYTGTEYFYFPVDAVDGVAVANFVPAELFEAPLYMGAGKGTAAPSNIKTSISLKCGLFTNVCYFEDGGHFKLYYPMKVNGKFLYGSSLELSQDFEALYKSTTSIVNEGIPHEIIYRSYHSWL